MPTAVMDKTWIRFERGRDGVIGPTYGPFPFVQQTYNVLRVGPNGDEFAIYDEVGKDWYIIGGDPSTDYYSDVIIYAGERPE